jgi:hypothetical protein
MNETGVSLHSSPVGDPGEGCPSTGNFSRRALAIEDLPLWEICEGNLEVGLLCWGP